MQLICSFLSSTSNFSNFSNFSQYDTFFVVSRTVYLITLWSLFCSLFFLSFLVVRSAHKYEKVSRPRKRRAAVSPMEGRCPVWSVLRNCSSRNPCKEDWECAGSQKCCQDACGNHACFDAVLPLTPADGKLWKSTIRALHEYTSCSTFRRNRARETWEIQKVKNFQKQC